ncbi:hypothetical protein ACVILE_000121 [Streptomyces sp. M18.1]
MRFLVSSPPTRECSGRPEERHGDHSVLPADAGVFRTWGPGCTSAGSPPRRRGGVPYRVTVAVFSSMSSPPTRGCSVGAGVGPMSATVLPRSPRQRGDVPTTGHKNNRPWSLPADRGCSDRSGLDVALRPVHPADAGVLRSSGRRPDGRSGPPRRRGGVPWHIRALFPKTKSFPSTRGCTDMPSPGISSVRPSLTRGCSERGHLASPEPGGSPSRGPGTAGAGLRWWVGRGPSEEGEGRAMRRSIAILSTTSPASTRTGVGCPSGEGCCGNAGMPLHCRRRPRRRRGRPCCGRLHPSVFRCGRSRTSWSPCSQSASHRPA